MVSLHVYKIQFSRSVMSNSLQPHEPQHTRPPCPSPTPGVNPNPCLSSQWWHPAISSSVVPFFSGPQSFPASGSLQMRPDAMILVFWVLSFKKDFSLSSFTLIKRLFCSSSLSATRVVLLFLSYALIIGLYWYDINDKIHNHF